VLVVVLRLNLETAKSGLPVFELRVRVVAVYAGVLIRFALGLCELPGAKSLKIILAARLIWG
jgi:hypothetical protein